MIIWGSVIFLNLHSTQVYTLNCCPPTQLPDYQNDKNWPKYTFFKCFNLVLIQKHKKGYERGTFFQVNLWFFEFMSEIVQALQLHFSLLNLVNLATCVYRDVIVYF